MAVTCPNCGKENPEGFAFCGFCTAPLGRPAAQAEERKVVTVLFCDLVGFTAASDEADPEEVRARLVPYHGMLRTEIERYGGTVEKFIGDAVMAVFGAPTGHEDDPERAVRSGLRIIEAIDELNDADPSLDLQVRIGINTGEAVVALGARPEAGEGIVTGDVVNTASRLQGMAPVGGVVVGEQTYRATERVFDYTELEPVTVKGKAAPVPIWRATAARARFGVDIEQAKTPFIGREDELEVLKRAYARAVRESSVQLVTVTGEPGVGKSRLTGEFASFLDDLPELVSWRQGRCLPYGEGITFWGLGEIVKAHTGILESDSPEVAGAKLAQAVELLVAEPSEREWTRARLAPLVGVATTGGSVERAESFAAWRGFIEAVAASGPLVLVFEDIHWADDAMIEFIEEVVEYSTGVPLLVLCLARPELYERRPGWSGGKRNSTTISLSPLTEQETARLLSALLERAVLPAETQALLLERAGGNPLYAEQFVRMLTDRGLLKGKGKLVPEGGRSGVEIPDSVQALIAARLDTLSPDRKSLLQDAAVIGKVFWSGAVASMGGLEESAVRASLHELSRKELVRAARVSSVEGQAEYAFWHALVREVAYSQIPRAARASKHVAAASWIEQLAGDRVSDHAELLAFHYEQALALARLTPDRAEVLRALACRFLMLAGDRAMKLDVSRADAYYGRALALLDPPDPDRPVVLGKAAEAAFQAGRQNEAERMFTEAVEGFRAHGDMLGAGEAMARLSDVLWYRGESVRSRAILDEAVELLEREPPGPQLAYAYTSVAGDRMVGGAAEEAIEWSDRALSLTRQFGVEDQTVRALSFRGAAKTVLGDSDGAEDLRAALKVGIDGGLGRETLLAYGNLSWNLFMAEGALEGLSILEEGIRFADRRGLASTVGKSNRAILLVETGPWEEALVVADEVMAWSEAHGNEYAGLQAAETKARVLIRMGRVREAEPLVEDFLPRARGTGDPQTVGPSVVTAALVRLAEGDPEAALTLVQEMAEATRGDPLILAWQLPDAVRVLVSAGALAIAGDLIPSGPSSFPGVRLRVETAQAILAEARGELDAALQLYGELIEGWEKFGSVFERGHALFGAGRCLIGLGRVAEGTASIREAREVLARLGARPLIEETDAWLARATALSS